MFPTFRRRIVSLLLGTLALFIGCRPVDAQSASASGDAGLGQRTFSACAGCHGLDGAGGEHAPNIASDAKVQRMPDAALLTTIRNGIPAGGMPGFGKLLNEIQIEAVVKYLRVLQGSGQKINAMGNSNAGQELFFGRARCADCHMVSGRGGFLAADLSDYGRAHSAASIREAIVAPNKNPDLRRGTMTVVTRAGKSYRGVVRNEDNFSLQMQTPDGIFHLFDKTELARAEHEPDSLMPSDYGMKLRNSELDDLVSFLSGSVSKGEEQANEDE